MTTTKRTCLRIGIGLLSVLLLSAPPARAQVVSETALEEVKSAARALRDEIFAVATKGETVRGPSGPLMDLAMNSGDLVCQSWIIAFSVSMRDAAVKQWPVELVQKLNELRWKIEKLCADPPPRVGTTTNQPLPPTTPRTPGRTPDQVDDAICRDKCSAEWNAYTQAIMAAADAENALTAAAADAATAQTALNSLLAVERSLQGRTEQAARMKALGLDKARQDATAKESARASAAAAAASARAKVDAAQAAYIACLEKCKKQGKKYRTVAYTAIGVGGTALAYGLSGSGSPTVPATTIQQSPAPPVSNAPAAPPSTSAPPVAPPPTAPAAPPNPAGTYSSRTSVAFDPGGHGPVLALEQQVLLTVTVSGQSVAIAAQGNPRWIGSTGAISSEGTFMTSGTGSAAGISGVAVTFNGRIDTSASPMRITGEYAVGTNGVLPQGQPIRYAIDGQKTASAATRPH